MEMISKFETNKKYLTSSRKIFAKHATNDVALWASPWGSSGNNDVRTA